MVIFLVGVEDGPGDDDTSVGREALTFGELGFRGRGAGFRSGSLLSHIGTEALLAGDLVPMIQSGDVRKWARLGQGG